MALSIRNSRAEDLAQELMDIAARCSRLPDLDRRTADEILGYDQNGAVG